MHAQKVTALTALAAASALALSGCAGGPTATAADVSADPEFSGTLSILTKFGGDPLGPYFETLAAEYEEQHPDVTIELIQETDQSVKDKTKTLTASGALPDIYFTWTGNWAENFIDGGLAADLTEVVAPGTEWGDTFGEASLSAFEVDGKYYGIPLYNNGKFMGYNTTIFEEVGIEVPTTFEELIESCAPIRAAGYEPIAFGNKDGWPALHYLQQLFAYNVPSDVLHDDFSPRHRDARRPGLRRVARAVQDPRRRVHRHRQRHERRALHDGARGARRRPGRDVLPGDPRVRHRHRRGQRPHARELRHLRPSGPRRRQG
ncbi:ABC-type glycerol-3-phosphate transport system substrate-binding protein [Agromyces albus]|nr:ABC-type glycerol-3-phosphate transport system substrate-binding protein [Agromyces albus]